MLRFKDRGKLFITGDYNGPTASETDVLDFDRYLDDETLYEFIDKTFLTTRVNQDDVIDSYGRRLPSFCKITDLIIANGRLGEDSNLRQYTFVSHNGCSVVDYLLCSFADSQRIKNFRILGCNKFSDHSPVYFTLPKVPISRDTLDGSNDQAFSHEKLLYHKERVYIFRNQLLTYSGVLGQLTENVNIGQIDVVQSFTNYMYDSAFSAFGKTWTSRSNATRHVKARAKIHGLMTNLVLLRTILNGQEILS